MKTVYATAYVVGTVFVLSLISLYFKRGEAVDKTQVCGLLEEASHQCSLCAQDRNPSVRLMHATRGSTMAQTARKMMGDGDLQKACRMDPAFVAMSCEKNQKQVLKHMLGRR